MNAFGPMIAYLVVKLTAYCLWSALGLRLLSPDRPSGAARALLLGSLRLIVGLVAGWLLGFAMSSLAPVPGRLGFSIGVFYPLLAVLRWMEWSLLSALIRRSASQLVVGRSRRDNLWRLGGVTVSCLTDVAVLFTVGTLGWMPC